MASQYSAERRSGTYLDTRTSLGAGQTGAWVEPAGDCADEALMARIHDGDQTAFRILMTRHIDRIVALARRIVGPAEAEDIAQDVFLKLWARKDQWSPGTGAFRTWLFKVALNRCIDATRRRRTEPLEEGVDPEDESKNPYEQFETNEAAQRLRAAISQLPMRQRIAVTLYYSHDLTAVEIASIMNLRVNAVESILKRARQGLRKLTNQ